MRNNQAHVLNEFCEAFNSGYKHILLEAPTGFGKSPLAVAVALTLGSSYICTSTKDLQAQYIKDFPFIRAAKGMGNFTCLIKEDLIKNNLYQCGACPSHSFARKNACCSHTTVNYGPCLISNSEIAQKGCVYRPSVSSYDVIDRGAKCEQVVLRSNYREKYQQKYLEWLQAKNLMEGHREWVPCEYYNQLNIARNASHSIFNYSMFLMLLPIEKIIIPREILILDEGHLLESEVLSRTSYIISKNKWRKYLPSFSIINIYEINIYETAAAWIDFLIQLEAQMLALLNDVRKIKDLFILRKQKYNWISNNVIKRITNKRITDFITGEGKEESRDNVNCISNEILELEDKIEECLAKDISRDIADYARLETDKLTQIIDTILLDPDSWIVTKVRKEYDEVVEVELKPLNISPYCKDLFERCFKTLVMSATILNPKAFCKTIGLNIDDVKFIQVESDFPIQNRPIYPLNIAHLNYNNLQLQETRLSIAKAVDNIMTVHGKDKGIIHTTSYKQLNFIRENISVNNSYRLLVTDPDIQREDVIAEHVNSTKPTVLISPSFYTGIDLKDELSRFQIITKIPYPNLSDRWINAKREIDDEWYRWQTALRLVQASGRSVRSREDWAKTYILDSAFGSFIFRNSNIFPDWFKQAIRSIDRKSLFKASLKISITATFLSNE
jgi:ATP-dependent DNA helicase DinG